MRLAWVTDPHLDFVEPDRIERFCGDLVASGVSGVLLGGDLCEAKELVRWLEFLDSRLGVPIYYVLGNHDYYGSSISAVRGRMADLRSPTLHWLPGAGSVRLGEEVVLVGHGGWGDCRIGDTEKFVILTDYLAIQELSRTVDVEALLAGGSDRARLREVLSSLGLEAASALRPMLLEAAGDDRTVLLLTHVPPFREACWHRGGISEEQWLPGFTCKAVGDLLIEVASANPDCRFTVLCGHTHGSGHVRMRPNLEVYTAEARYGDLFFRIVEVSGREVTPGPREEGSVGSCA